MYMSTLLFFPLKKKSNISTPLEYLVDDHFMYSYISFLFFIYQGDDLHNGEVKDEAFSLQELYDFINRMLHLTDVTKKTLQLECDEAKFALKPWTIESTVVKPIDKSTCICREVRQSFIFIPFNY